jgi:hypothetical protein
MISMFILPRKKPISLKISFPTFASNYAMATRQQIYRIWVLARNSPFLANSSTRQNDPFRKWVGLAKFVDIRKPGLLGLARLARLADIRQTILWGLIRLAKGKFCVNLASLANLASFANLASVG